MTVKLIVLDIAADDVDSPARESRKREAIVLVVGGVQAGHRRDGVEAVEPGRPDDQMIVSGSRRLLDCAPNFCRILLDDDGDEARGRDARIPVRRRG